MTLTNSDWYFNLNGNIPINLSFDDTLGQRLVDRPQMLNLSGRGKSFGVIPLFLPDIEYLRGDFTSRVQVSGTPFHPSLDGNIEMKNGEMKLDPVKDPLTKVVLNITMKDDRIYFQQVEAELEGKALIKKKKPWQKYLKDVLTFGYLFPDKVPKGKVAVTGEIQVKGFNDFLYDLKIKGINFPFLYEYMDVGGIANPELAVAGETPPTVSGKINLTQLLYEEPFGSPVTLALAGRKAANPSSQWGWDFTIEAVDNIWVKNSDMNAEFAGEVQVYRVEGKLIMLGTLDALQGQFFVAGRSFDIEEGQIIFENTDDLDPSLNFLVTTQIYESPDVPDIAVAPSEPISLRITGTLSQPEIATAEGSKYTREQVLEMIVLQSQPGSTDGRSSPFQEKVIGGLGASVGSQLVQKFAYDLGVETFYIRPARGSGFDFSESEITLGGYLARGLYWQYSSKFSSNPDVELQYRLNRNLFLEGNRDRDNLYHLGLNLRWEF
jgi:autotransporter translocation and assembly factor TamB